MSGRIIVELGQMTVTPRIMRLRCFVGIPCQLPDAAQPLLEELKRLAQRGIRVVPTANLHITLKFIGAVDQDQVGFLDSILRNRSSKQAVLNLRCHGIEFLNNSVCLGIESTDTIEQLALRLYEGFAFLGYAVEEKKFKPHITLARFDKSAKGLLKNVTAKYSDRHWGDFIFDRYQLYRSETLPEGARYTVLGDYNVSAARGIF